MNRLILIVMGALVVAALIAGFAVVGGPGQARMERQDEDRAQDLRALYRYLQCGAANMPLPDTLDSAAYCPDLITRPDMADAVTGEAYVYRRKDDSHFEVCAVFATLPEARGSDHRTRELTFEGAVGCLAGVTRAQP